MGFNVDLWNLLIGQKPVAPPIPEDVSDARNYPNQTLYGPQDVADAYRSIRYGEDTVPKPPRVGNPRDIALPTPKATQRPSPFHAADPQVPEIERSIAARGAQPATGDALAEGRFVEPMEDPVGLGVLGVSPADRLPPPPPPSRGQVNVTINGKTYDYGAGESIPDSLAGNMGPMTEPIYAGTGDGDASVQGYRQYGGQGRRGSASMVQLSDDSTTPMADQLRLERLARTNVLAAQGAADMAVADPLGAEVQRRADIETGAIAQRGQTGLEQAVEAKRRLADAIAQQESEQSRQIDMDAERNVATELNRLRAMPQYQQGGLPERMAMEQALRAKAMEYVEQQKREASISLYSRYGLVRPTLKLSDPNDPMATGRPGT